MSRARAWIGRLVDGLAHGLEAAVTVMFAAMVLVVLWGVCSRFVLGSPARWTEEAAVFLLMWLALLGASVAFRRRQHLGVDYFATMLHPAAQRLLAVAAQALIAFFALAVLVYGGGVLVGQTLVAEQRTPATGIRMGYVYAVVPLSGLFVALFAVERAIELLRPASAPSRDQPTPHSSPKEDA